MTNDDHCDDNDDGASFHSCIDNAENFVKSPSDVVIRKTKNCHVPYEVIRDIVAAMLIGGRRILVLDLRQHPYMVIPLVSRSFREAYFDVLTQLQRLYYHTGHPDKVIFCRPQKNGEEEHSNSDISGKLVWPGTVGLLASHGRHMPRLKHVDIICSSTHFAHPKRAIGRTDSSPAECLLHLVCPAIRGVDDKRVGVIFEREKLRVVDYSGGSLSLDSAQISVWYEDSRTQQDAKLLSIDCILGLNASITKISFLSCQSLPPIAVPNCISGAATGSRDLSRITCLRIAWHSHHHYHPFGDTVGWSIPLFTYLLSACGGLKLLHVVLSSECTLGVDEEMLDNCYDTIPKMSELVLADVPAITKAAAAIWVEFKLKVELNGHVLHTSAYPLFRLGQLKSLVKLNSPHLEMTREVVAVAGQNSSSKKNPTWMTSLLPIGHLGSWADSRERGDKGRMEDKEHSSTVGPKVVSFTVKTSD